MYLYRVVNCYHLAIQIHMKLNKSKSTLVLALSFSLFFSCKKTKEDGPNETNKELTIDRVFQAPPMEQADKVAASMDGKYAYTLSTMNPLFTQLTFTKDRGQNWQSMTINFRADHNLCITKGGYAYLKAGITRKLYHLETQQEVAIDYPGGFTQEEDHYLGDGDYIYAKNQFKKIGETAWQTMSATGVYCGQDVNKGGAGFYDVAQKKLNIHQPDNNTITTHNITIDLSKVVSGNIAPNTAPSYLYNGYNKFAMAYNKGIAIQDLSSGSVTYTEWRTPTAAFIGIPATLGIDKEGTVFATLGNFGAFKLVGNTFSPFFVRSPYTLTSKGEYTYYLSGISLIKESKNAKQKPMAAYYAKLTKNSGAGRLTLKSARTVGGKTFALLAEDASRSALYVYSPTTKDFELLEPTVGKYEYLYAEGSQLILYGSEYILRSTDNGSTWTSHPNSAGTGKSITYALRSGTSYYGLHVRNYKTALGGTGHEVDKHNYATYSSTDGLNWKAIASKSDQSGKGPEALTAEGLMTYRYNQSAPGYSADMRSQVSYDYGATWNSMSALGFNGIGNNELFLVSYDGTGVDIQRFDKNFKELGSQRAKPSGTFSVAGVANVHVDNENKLSFINPLGFFKIR